MENAESYEILFDRYFLESYSKLTDKEKKIVDKAISHLSLDPYYPSLRTEKLQGYKELFSSRVNDDIRIIWYFQEEYLIVTLDVGHHKEIYKHLDKLERKVNKNNEGENI